MLVRGVVVKDRSGRNCDSRLWGKSGFQFCDQQSHVFHHGTDPVQFGRTHAPVPADCAGPCGKKTGLVLSAGTLVLLLPCQRSANSRLDFRPYTTAFVEHDTRLSRELAMPVAEHGNHPGNQSHNHS
jgi:hypothetical protein